MFLVFIVKSFLPIVPDPSVLECLEIQSFWARDAPAPRRRPHYLAKSLFQGVPVQLAHVDYAIRDPGHPVGLPGK